MADENLQIQKVSAATKSAVSRKSAQTLPNQPSAQGYSAEEIKRRFYQPILDAANSALAEIDRVVDEANLVIGDVKGKLDDFIGNSELAAPYKKDLDATVWVLNQTTGKYEFVVTKSMHGVEDYKEIYVDMYLFGEGGKLVNCNNYDIYTNGDVRLYNENTGAGFVAIARNRDGFVKVYAVTEIDNVIGASKVAKSNDYNDLDNKPSLAQIGENEEMIAKIITGQQKVNNALNAVNATNAQTAANAENAQSAVTAQSATRATQDGNGANIASSYAKVSGTYLGMNVGHSDTAQNAANDGNGANIAGNYVKQSGTYNGLNVGYAVSAGSAASATTATKAAQDGNGANIASTYATKQSVTDLGTGMTAQVSALAKALYPVGSIRISTVNTNPSTYIAGTTWVAWGSGRVPVGVNTSDTNFNTVEKTGGSKDAIVVTHKHNTDYTGSHTHNVGLYMGGGGSCYGDSQNANDSNRITPSVWCDSAGGHSHTITEVGSSGTNANLQPYITCYMWKRTA